MNLKKSKLYDYFKRKSKGNNIATISYLSLFRFASRWDLFVIFIGFIFTILKAFTVPVSVIVYGEFTSLLVERMYGIGTSTPTIMLAWFGGGKVLTNATLAENRNEIINDSIAYGILMLISTILQFIAGIFCVDCFNGAAIRQVTRIRCKLFEALMRQDIAWYDTENGKTNFSVRFTADIERIKAGIAEQVSHFLYLTISFAMLVILAFCYGWELTLIVISYVPILFAANIFIGKLQTRATAEELNAYACAANHIEEVLGGIRTVFAFGGEKSEVNRYKSLLIPTNRAARRKGLFSSINDGIPRLLFFVSCALSFWFGVRWVLEDRDKTNKSYTPTDLITIFFSLVWAVDNIAEVTPFIEAFAVARGSAKGVFAVIDRKSTNGSMADSVDILNTEPIQNIEFKNVSFSYPSRPNVPILQGFNLKIEAGQTIGLVGDSGNGKSTCLHLLQRFYDPAKGAILVNDCNIMTINIDTLRSKVASVGQEPVLFSTSILENIRYGNPSATEKDIINAAQNSGAHDFISQLPNGYDTLVSGNLSGGQKQRIAIARALIKNPEILLLDEATSALDYESEKYIQETLDNASKGRTTIVVSHRLSAIRNADRIIFIKKGQVVEEGTHSELIDLKGQYYKMVHSSDTVDTKEKPKVKHLKTKIVKKNHKVKSEKPELRHIDSCDSLSSSSEDDISEADEKPEYIKYWSNFKRIVILVKPDWMILCVAIISAFIIGAAIPLFSVVFAEVYETLSLPDPVDAMNTIFTLCYIFIGLGILIFSAAIAQTYLFARAGANLTERVRSMTFKAMLEQECGWFDDEKHSVGALSTFLCADAANLQTAIGYPLSMILQAISTFTTGILISLFSSVTLTLVCLMSVPLLLIAVTIEAKHQSKSELSEKEAIRVGMRIATEAINNIRTVASLRQEQHMAKRFLVEMTKVEMLANKKAAWRGLINSFSQAIPLLVYAIGLTYAGFMVANEQIYFKNVIRVSEAMLYGTFFMCKTLVFAPAIITAFVGAHNVFKIIDRIPLIQSPETKKKGQTSDEDTNIKYKGIDFHYPTRPDVQILNDFSLHIQEGKTIAFVGPSGCGKSTCIQLLQRLYDPENGEILVGDNNICTDISIADLRSKLSIVSQEPILFQKTIAENIAYGDSKREVTMPEIIEVAKIANIHDFIVKLPLGYDTNLGKKGTQLSGGQKQRIAIARAMIRNPKILLLDEATSALDLHSEQVVQQALDAAKTGRTCIIIAHRLSTVQNADAICILQNGRIAEIGTHDQLLAMNGTYTRLFNAQN